MKRIIFTFILALITFGIYSGVLALIGLSSTVMNILAIAIAFSWILITYKLVERIWK